MAEIREITTLCKSGKVKDAYELAKNDLLASPDYPESTRMGFILYDKKRCGEWRFGQYGRTYH